MTLDELIRSKRIREQDAADDDIATAIDKARSDLLTASSIMKSSNSWAFAIAYNAVLQTGRAYMFANGYRPASHEGHKNVFLFLQTTLPEQKTLVTYLDRMRIKRNESIYDANDLITESEAELLLERAEEFLDLILATEEIKKLL